ncbi:13E12 repeat family protein [Mycobacterium sp.]|uniref:13E12 repeat family protein n=1 Tax=Mycobacterium sp. TaxID=1785 RepID=UPI003D6B0700
MASVEQALPVDAVRAQMRADLELIEAAYARLRASCTDLVGNAFRVATAERLEALGRVNRGLSYRMFGEIADPVDGPEDPGLPAGVSMRNLLCARLRITSAEVKRRFRVAVRIRPRRSLTGPALPPELPKLATAVEDGSVGDDHIAAVLHALDGLPGAVSAPDRDKAERILVRHARKQDATFVTVVGNRIADWLNPDGTFSDEDRARRRGLVLGPQCVDGMSRLRGWLDPETRAYLEAITAAIRPGRHVPEAKDAADEERDHRTPAQRCHDALKLALRHALSSGQLGVHRGVPVTVIVTTKLGDLEQAARAAHDPAIPMPAPARTGGNSRLPMRDVIRMAANSIHYLAVFEDHCERPLYLGRSKRIATLDQRIICHARDGGCTRPDCPQPGYHCEVHHAQDWAAGGLTNADSLYFGCAPDHTEATCGHLTTTITDDYRLAWSDGTGPPRINHIHHPDELLEDDDEDDP